MKKTRQANLELLRLLAMVFVVTAHLMNHGNLIGAAKRGTASYYLVWTLFVMYICCYLINFLFQNYFLLLKIPYFQSFALNILQIIFLLVLINLFLDTNTLLQSK